MLVSEEKSISKAVDTDKLDIVEAFAAVNLEEDPRSQDSNYLLGQGEREQQETNPLWWSPLEPDDLDVLRSGAQRPSEFLFSNEELAEALKHIGDELVIADTEDSHLVSDDEKQTAGVVQALSSEDLNNNIINESTLLEDPLLPDFDIPSTFVGDADSSEEFLFPQNGWSNIFSEQQDLEPVPLPELELLQVSPADPGGLPSILQESLDFQDENDEETLAILKQLQSLSLDIPPISTVEEQNDYFLDKQKKPRNTGTQESRSKELVQGTSSEFEEGGISYLLYCQPCPVVSGDTENDHIYSPSVESSNSLGSVKEVSTDFLAEDISPLLYCQPCPLSGVDAGAENPAQSDEEILEHIYCQCCYPNQQNATVEFEDKKSADGDLISLNLLGQYDDQYATDIDDLLAQLSVPNNSELAREAEAGKRMSNEELLEGSRQVISSSVMAAAQPWLKTFQVNRTEQVSPDLFSKETKKILSTTRKNVAERCCLGHRERILSVQFSPCGQYIASASADSTIRLWHSATNQLLTTLSHHDSNYECLRVSWGNPQWLREDATDNDGPILATGGADGQVFILQRKCKQARGSIESWEIAASIDHSKGLRHFDSSDDGDRPQIYSLQFISDWKVTPTTTSTNRFLLTSSEDHVHIWEMIEGNNESHVRKLPTVAEGNEDDLEHEDREHVDDEEEKIQYQWHFREVFSIGFGDLHSGGYGVSVGRVTEQANAVLSYTNPTIDASSSRPAYGGDRNPKGTIFVFDASYCPTNGLLGVALSDGSLRLLNGRGVCMTVLQLPGVLTHLTSFSWDSTGTQLATSVSNTGHVITWEILLNESQSDVTKTACRSVLGGGHESTVFGTRYLGTKNPEESDPLLLSWGADGRLSLWDAQVISEEIDAPIATLVNIADYPIFGVDFHESTSRLAVVGGAGDGGFIGIPVIIFDVEKPRPKGANLRNGEDDSDILYVDPIKKPKISKDAPKRKINVQEGEAQKQV